MADSGQDQSQYNQLYTLGLEPGIKRDGTRFESRECDDGVWCRFQRGVPKKIGGYVELFASFNGVARGMVMNSANGVNYIYAGNENGLDVFTTGQTFNNGSGPYVSVFTLGYSEQTISSNTGTTFTVTSSHDLSSAYVAGTQIIFNQTTPTYYTVVSSVFASGTTTVTFSPPLIGTVTNVWIADLSFESDPKLLWQFDFQYSPVGGSLNVLAHPGLNLDNIDNGVISPVYVGSNLPNNSNKWVFSALADTAGLAPTYKSIAVDGGVCVLHPFIFVYGSNGFIANNNVSSIYQDRNLSDWNGPLANQTNVAAGKIVKGMPIRGGTSSPSGLFWATDSLIRVSFVNNGSTYWQYDIVSSETSIMSSSAVVEMDGIFFWMGVDRFYMYNGLVQVLPNDKNVNWLFNNLNYGQRQKVWATKVPRYNEIWFFYPRGSATECTDAIIYNVKDKCWYDAGQAEGAQRSCGFTTEVYPTPIWADWNYNVSYGTPDIIINTPTGQSAPTAFQLYLSGNQSPKYRPGQYLTFSTTSLSAPKYLVVTSEFINNTIIGSPGATLVTVSTNMGSSPSVGTPIFLIQGGNAYWQHEVGLNKVTLTNEFAIYSSFTTSDISWVGGGPSTDATPSINRRTHLRRLEPDFVQSGIMDMYVLGSKFARGPIESSGPFRFDENTEKIDLRVEYRLMLLKFISNTIDGNYEMGRILITAELGDERP